MSSSNTGHAILIYTHPAFQIMDDDSFDQKATIITIDPNELVGGTIFSERVKRMDCVLSNCCEGYH
jgi:hypothetical protein